MFVLPGQPSSCLSIYYISVQEDVQIIFLVHYIFFTLSHRVRTTCLLTCSPRNLPSFAYLGPFKVGSLGRYRRSDFEPGTRSTTNSSDKANQPIEDAEAFGEDSVGA